MHMQGLENETRALRAPGPSMLPGTTQACSIWSVSPIQGEYTRAMSAMYGIFIRRLLDIILYIQFETWLMDGTGVIATHSTHTCTGC